MGQAIGPNEALVFEVTLVDVMPGAEPVAVKPAAVKPAVKK